MRKLLVVVACLVGISSPARAQEPSSTTPAPQTPTFRSGIELVTIDVGVEILDEQLAPETLAEEFDVASDHGAEVEEYRRRVRRESGQELGEGFGGQNGSIGAARGIRRRTCLAGALAPPLEEI